MAPETNAPSQIQEFLRVLRRRRWQIALPALFVFVLGCSFAVIVPKKYVVDTRIEIRESRTEGDYMLRNPQETATAREIQNAKQHIQHHNRIAQILKAQGKLWPEYVGADERMRGEIIGAVRESITVDVLEKGKAQGSTFVDISYADVDVERAETFLRELTQRWVQDVHERDLDALQRERQIKLEQVKDAREGFNVTNGRWIEHARQMRVDPSKPPGEAGGIGGTSSDHTFAMLDGLRSQREDAQGRLEIAVAALEDLQQVLEQEPDEVLRSREVEGESYQAEITKLQETIFVLRGQQSKLTSSHSQWRRLEHEISMIEEAIDQLRLQERGAGVVQEWIPNPRITQFGNRLEEKALQVASLRTEVTSLNDRIADYEAEAGRRIEDYSLLMELWEDRQRTLTELNASTRLLTEKEHSLEIMREAYGKPYEIVKPALARSAPTEPSGLLIALFSLFAGLALGLAVALLAEYGRNSYRTVYDLASVMDVPVLGTIGIIRTRHEEKRARTRHLTVGVSSAIILGGVTWVTWVWYAAPEKLPLQVLQAIEGFQRLLM